MPRRCGGPGTRGQSVTLQPDQTEAAGAAASGTRAALFVGGFTTFCLLYYVQALLPIFSWEFGVSPTQSSLALSLTTGVMAFALLLAGALSDAVGRKRIMFYSLFLSSALTLAMAFTPNWAMLLAVRLFMGISLCGVQSVAMAYMSEELDRSAFAPTLGLFIGGSALGGMFGRLFASVVADHLGWRTAVAMIGLTGLCAALYFKRALPPSQNFVPRGHIWKHLRTDLSGILADKGLLALFVVGFVVMSGFVTIYNYISYRLLSAPFSLSQTSVGFVFVVYVFGSIGAALAGRLVNSYRRDQLLWIFQIAMLAGILLTLADALSLILLGLAILTFGMFASHSVASGWVSFRARRSKAFAASLYLFAYYQGGSLIGAVGGLFYQEAGWVGIVVLTTALGLLGVLCSLAVRRADAS